MNGRCARLLSRVCIHLHDSDFIEALGLTKCTAPKNRASLNWSLMHDPHPSVRAEAIHAFKTLGCVQNDSAVRDWFITLLQTDVSDAVKREAEKVLVEFGVILPATNGLDEYRSDNGSSEYNRTPQGLNGRIPPHLSLPFPHILSGKTPEEIGIYLRDSLIEDKEQLDVIQQVKLLAKKEKVIEQVNYEARHSGVLPKLEIDLDMAKAYIPNLKSIHQSPKRRYLTTRNAIKVPMKAK